MLQVPPNDRVGPRRRVEHAPASPSPHTAAAGSLPQAFDPWRVVRRALIGRYRLACWLGAWGACAGAVVGWFASPPVYRSEGLVRIASVLPQVIEETEQNRPMAMFDAYLQSQQMLLGSRGLLEAAVADEAWVGLGRKPSPADVPMLAANLKVEFRPRTDYLRVFYTDPDPSVAAAAVHAVINSYERVYQEQQGESRRQRVKALEDRRSALAARLETLETQIQARVDDVGTTDLEPVQTHAVQRALKLDVALADVRRALIAARAAPAAPPPATAPSSSPDPAAEDIAPERLALTDPIMRGYLDAQARREDEVARLQAFYGDEHPQLLRARQALERGRQKIDQYAHAARPAPRPSAAATAPAAAQFASASRGAGAPARTVDMLRAEEASLAEQQADLKRELKALGVNRFRMDRLRADEETTRKELADVTRRAATLDTEESLGGRLSVISRGDVPLAPLLNPRLRDAGVGMVAGFVAPGGVLVLASLLRPRYRGCLQAANDLSPLSPMFAAIPRLEKDAPDEPSGLAAARCVHQMRVTLSAGAPTGRKSNVYLLTSASGGEGKTNLALSLGASFSAAGYRTLVIDGDLAGRGVTVGLGLESLPGLREAAEGGGLRSHVRGTRGGLCVLPTGKCDGRNANTLVQSAVDRLVAEARALFDVILIDTGAVFAGVEASALATQADGVVFVVARGQRETLVAQSFAHLDSLGVPLAGIVFNGADPDDYDRATQVSTAKNFFDRTRVFRRPPSRANFVTGFGPVTDSVLSSLPATQVEGFELLYKNPPALQQPHVAPAMNEAA